MNTIILYSVSSLHLKDIEFFFREIVAVRKFFCEYDMRIYVNKFMKMALFDAYFLNAFLSLFSERMVKMGWNFTQTPPTFSSFGGKRCSKIRREWCTIEAKRYCSEMRCIYLKRCHFFILKSSWNLKRGVYFSILDIYTSCFNFCLDSPSSNLKMLTTAEIETLRTIS